jgi:hypothetical protein
MSVLIYRYFGSNPIYISPTWHLGTGGPGGAGHDTSGNGSLGICQTTYVD